MRPLLIRAHKARVASHIGGEDCGEAADGGHLSRSGRDIAGRCGTVSTGDLPKQPHTRIDTSCQRRPR
jgi:hypothetical protein